MTFDGVYNYKYDVWNRLVKVQRQGPTSDPQVVAEYRYDGVGHRIKKVVTNSGNLDRTEYYYYNQNWQLLEIDNEDNVARQQFVWGTNYIDEAVCMDVDTNNDGDCTDSGGSRHFFYMQDANWNVVALREGMSIVERYEYDPYGTVRIYRGSASPGAAEQRTVTGQSLKWLDASLPGNPVLYAGYFHDDETGLYHVRHRMLARDRWMQRDPLGTGLVSLGLPRAVVLASMQYLDGQNLYEYVRGKVTEAVDPKGLHSKMVLCPNRKPRPGYQPSVNGCGPFGSWYSWLIPDGLSCPAGYINFKPACDDHDRCYGKCNSDKAKCDLDLYGGMIGACQTWWEKVPDSKKEENYECYGKCMAMAEIYYHEVREGGHDAYEGAQEEACICDCPPPPIYPPPPPGQYCIPLTPEKWDCPDFARF